MERASKFDPLYKHLCRCQDASVQLAFREIERIIGRSLGPSFYSSESNWNKHRTHPITHAWLRARYVRDRVDLTAEVLYLRRDPFAAAAILRSWGVPA